MRSFKSFFITTLCVAALATPIAILADTGTASDSTQTNPTTNQPASESGHHHHGMFGMLRNLNLTPQQQDQIKAIKDTYKRAHPEGSQPDPAARKALRDQILGVLTPDQRTKLQTEMQNWKNQHPEVAPTTKP